MGIRFIHRFALRVRVVFFRYFTKWENNLSNAASPDHESYERGSVLWLVAAERHLGGVVNNVPRRVVSPLDHRTKAELESGGMTGGDRMGLHGYARPYFEHLQPHLNTSGLTIVECGVLNGSGLALWSLLFPDAKIIGLDIDLNYALSNVDSLRARGAFRESNPELLYFDQLQPNVSGLKESLGGSKIDIFIDDGLHTEEAILRTMEAVRPMLAKNFTYFIEDNWTVYRSLKKTLVNDAVRSLGQMTVVTPGSK